MSALPAKADIERRSHDVRYVPKADIASLATFSPKPVIRSVELIVQPDAHDVVGEVRVGGDGPTKRGECEGKTTSRGGSEGR